MAEGRGPANAQKCFPTTVLLQISQLYGSEPLLPDLRVLSMGKFAFYGSPETVYFPFFCSPSLRKVWIWHRAESQNVFTAIETLSRQCFSIKSLVIGGDNGIQESWIDPRPYQQLFDNASLEQLALGANRALDPAGYTHAPKLIVQCGSFPMIRCLDIILTDELMGNFNVKSEDFLPGLEELAIHASQIRYCMTFLDALTSPARLKRLEVLYSDARTIEVMELFNTVANILSAEKLVHLHLIRDGSQQLRRSAAKRRHEILLPLLVFRNLHSLVVHVDFSFRNLNNDLMLQIANAMPNLRIIDLMGWEKRTQVNWDGIIQMNKRLSLEFLGLRLDTTHLHSEEHISFPDLRVLSPRNTPIGEENTSRLIQLIQRHFPNLRYIVVGDAKYRSSRRWANVATAANLERPQSAFIESVKEVKAYDYLNRLKQFVPYHNLVEYREDGVEFGEVQDVQDSDWMTGEEPGEGTD